MMRGSATQRRQRWVRFAALGACVLLSSLAAGAETQPAHVAAAPPTANAALEQLMAGNRRFAAGTPTHGHESAARRTELTASQHPVATILGCSDSRVPVELLFDQGFGDLFVVRVAGNVVGTDDLGSVEYDPALSQAQKVHQGVEANVRQSIRQLQATAELMQPHEGAAPMIVGGVYELDTGKVRLLK